MTILNTLTDFATPMLANKLATTLGIPEAAARRTLQVAMPLLLAMVLKRAKAPGGAEALGGALGGLDPEPLRAFGGLLDGDAPKVTNAAAIGGERLDGLLGPTATTAAATKLASFAGLDPAAAKSLLGIAGGVALAGIKQTATDRHLDPAGLVSLLESERATLSRGIPADLAGALRGSGLVDDGLVGPPPQPQAPARPAARPEAAPQAPAATRSGFGKWILLVTVLALGAWAASRLLTPTPPPPAPAPAPAPKPAPSAEAAPPAAAPVANPLVVNGIDVGARAKEVLGNLTGTLNAVTDAGSAQSALESLRATDTALGGLKPQIDALAPEGKAALRTQLEAALPAIRATAERLSSDPAVGPLLRPILDSILAKLGAYAG